MQKENFEDTDTKNWIGKHTPISVSNSLNLVKETCSLWNSDPHHLATSFTGALENLALQWKASRKSLFFDIETTLKIKLGSTLEKLTQRQNRWEQADLDEYDNEICTSTELFQMQKKQLIDLQEHSERYCNVSPIFGVNSAKYYLNLIKSYLLPPFLLTSVTLNLLLSKKRTSRSRSNLVIVSSWILWTFLVEQQALSLFWRHKKLQNQTDFSTTESLNTLTKRRMQNFFLLTPFTVTFVTSIPLKPNTRTLLVYWKVDWPQNNPLSN